MAIIVAIIYLACLLWSLLQPFVKAPHRLPVHLTAGVRVDVHGGADIGMPQPFRYDLGGFQPAAISMLACVWHLYERRIKTAVLENATTPLGCNPRNVHSKTSIQPFLAS